MKRFKLRLGRPILIAMVVALLLIPTVAQAQSVDILKLYNDYSNQTNPDELIKYFTDDAVFQDPGGPIQGKVAILAKLKEVAAMQGAGNTGSSTPKYIVAPRVEGNKVLSRQSVAVPGQNITLEVDFTTEFQGDKVKKVLIAPTPESLQKLAALQGQGRGGAPGAPNTGTGGAAVTAVTKEDNMLLLLALLASAVVIVTAAGVGLLMSRRTTRH